MNRVFPDIAPVVMDQVIREAHFLSKTKTVFNGNQIDSKTKSLRYLGELVKFGVAPPIVALRAFKSFLADFSSHNVDFMTTLLESCGRYFNVVSSFNCGIFYLGFLVNSFFSHPPNVVS